jgi:hypothetical protein
VRRASSFAHADLALVRNTSPKTVTYHFKHNPSVSLLTHNKNSIYPLVTPGTSSRAASARFSRGKITLKKGQSASIYISFKAPTLTASTFPLYSGFIGITSSRKESFSIPYMGMAASLYNLPVLDSGAEVAGATLPLVADANMNIQTGERTYTLAGDDYPVLHLRFTGESNLLSSRTLTKNSWHATRSNRGRERCNDVHSDDSQHEVLAQQTATITGARSRRSIRVHLYHASEWRICSPSRGKRSDVLSALARLLGKWHGRSRWLVQVAYKVGQGILTRTLRDATSQGPQDHR